MFWCEFLYFFSHSVCLNDICFEGGTFILVATFLVIAYLLLFMLDNQSAEFGVISLLKSALLLEIN